MATERSEPGKTDLMIAAAEGDLSRVMELIGPGTDLEEKDLTGVTALAAAIRGGHRETAYYLIRLGANLYTKDNEHKMPMDSIFNPVHKYKYEKAFAETKKLLGTHMLNKGSRPKETDDLEAMLHVISTKVADGDVTALKAILNDESLDITPLIERGDWTILKFNEAFHKYNKKNGYDSCDSDDEGDALYNESIPLLFDNFMLQLATLPEDVQNQFFGDDIDWKDSNKNIVKYFELTDTLDHLKPEILEMVDDHPNVKKAYDDWSKSAADASGHSLG